MKTFSFVGWSGGGKTTLVSHLIKQFRLKGKKVIAVKNAKHKYYLEPESADTFKFLNAGAEEVCLIAKNELLTMKRINETTDVTHLLQTLYADCDLLLFEGLTGNDSSDIHPITLIEVFDADQHDSLKFPVEKLSAVISDKPITTAIPIFKRDDIDAISRFMENS